jgi:signal transduction histidine kinase/ActR/RegA family two-component response regulator
MYDAKSWQIKTLARVLSVNTTATLVFDDPKTANEILSSLSQQPTVDVACLFKDNGELFASYISPKLKKKDSKFPPLNKAIENEQSRFEQIRNNAISTAYTFPYEDNKHGTLYLRENLSVLKADLLDNVLVSIGVLIVSLGAGIALAGRLQKRFTRPIFALVETMRKVSENGDYSTRVTKDSEDELGSLQEGLNLMLKKIEHGQTELQKARNELEHRVEARTSELSNANNSLASEISHRKKTELKLREAKNQAEMASRAKSEFLANMSHEIRTPMTAILGYVDLLADDTISREELLSHVETIRRNGKHLLAIISDILDLSKIESGKMSVERIDMPLIPFLEEIRSLMLPTTEVKGLDLRISTGGLIPRLIQTDPFRLRQILINIIGNAVKFTKKGEIEVRVRMVDTLSVKNPRLEFSIRDTGIGMVQEQVDRIFLPFEQANSSSTRQFGGTGLGLAISRFFVEALGGEIHVKSKELQGSCFEFTIETGPITAGVMHSGEHFERKAPAKKSIPMAEQKLPFRILIAEDGLDNQRLFSTILSKSGANVTVVENGQLAIVAVYQAEENNQPYDLVLMDMQMPVCDGYEATRRLREAGYRLPIIALTAHAMVEDRDKCISSGCDDFVTKPIQREKLTKTILKHLLSDVSV